MRLALRRGQVRPRAVGRASLLLVEAVRGPGLAEPTKGLQARAVAGYCCMHQGVSPPRVARP